MGYAHLEVEVSEHVGKVWLNRPDKKNALTEDMWEDLPGVLSGLGDDPEVRAVIVAGRGDSFTVGIDLGFLASLRPAGTSSPTRAGGTYRTIKRLQRTVTAFAECPKPVIAAVHGYCLGAGVDIISACDIRLAAADAVFGVRETRLAMVADVGTLQRLPGLIPAGHVAELAYTGKDIGASEAERMGLVNRVYADANLLHDGAGELARDIAANSPLAVQGTKAVLRAGETRSVDDALDHVALWNAAFLHSNDLDEAIAAHLDRRDPRFTGE